MSCHSWEVQRSQGHGRMPSLPLSCPLSLFPGQSLSLGVGWAWTGEMKVVGSLRAQDQMEGRTHRMPGNLVPEASTSPLPGLLGGTKSQHGLRTLSLEGRWAG